MSERTPVMLALRGFAVPVRPQAEVEQKPGRSRKRRKALPRASRFTLVFDTETTTDEAMNLRFGTYQVWEGDTRIHNGIFYEPAHLTSGEPELIRRYTAETQLSLLTREEFVREVFYRYAYDLGGMVVGLNLPFDLCRLAIGFATSHGKDMRGGFSLTLLPEKWRPNVLIKHLNSRTAFIRFAATAGASDGRSMRKKGFKTQARIGHFLDLRTLGSALLGRSVSLESLCDLLGTEHRKHKTDEHGETLTREYLDYAVNDTQATWECYRELLKLYDAHGLTETLPQRIYSEASLGKACLRHIGVETWRKQQPDFPADALGIILSTYYGGRAEIRIRRQAVRVLYCDFRSMYPTVCTLMGLWSYVIATGIDNLDATDATRTFLERITSADLQRQEIWRELAGLVEVRPDADILPARARYGEGARTIGLNDISAKGTLWYTLTDCIASKLHTGKAPEVVRAIRYAPREPQSGLKPMTIGDYVIDPYTTDLYKTVIEQRGRVQQKRKTAMAEGHTDVAERLNAQQQMLKLLANSTSYGIFAELNVQTGDRPRAVRVHAPGEEPFETGTRSIEEPGSHFHPLLATLITGAARLMLSLAECVALDQGIGWALCDTDSLALARPDGMEDGEFLRRAQVATRWFDNLSPYDDDAPLFKIEDVNYALEGGKIVPGRHEPLYVCAVSAKRYCLYDLDRKGRPVIRKALAHGLGHWRAPYGEGEGPATIPLPAMPLREIGCDRWHYDLWHQIVLAELQGHPDQVDLSPLGDALNRPAASRYAASTAPLLGWFKRFNAGKPLAEQVKPFNFMVAFQASETKIAELVALGRVDGSLIAELPAPIAPFDSNPAKAADRVFDRRTGRPLPSEILASYRETLATYHLHSESKFENGETLARGLTKRRRLEVFAVEYIGKEANRWEEQFYLGDVEDARIEYGSGERQLAQFRMAIKRYAAAHGVGELARRAGISRQQLTSILDGSARPRLATIATLGEALIPPNQ